MCDVCWRASETEWGIFQSCFGFEVGEMADRLRVNSPTFDGWITTGSVARKNKPGRSL